MLEVEINTLKCLIDVFLRFEVASCSNNEVLMNSEITNGSFELLLILIYSF